MAVLAGIAVVCWVLWLLLAKPPKAEKALVAEPLAAAPVIDLKDLPPDVARQIEGLPARTLDELQRQWLNTIGLIDRVGEAKAPPFIVMRNAIGHEWARRLAIAEHDPNAFPWPTTKAPPGKNGLDSGDWHLIGMLSYLGYRVGATQGVSDGIRHQILDACFSAALPPINGLSYMQSWGAAGTTVRLRKLANELASFARNGKRKRSSNLARAVNDWEADLNYLYRRYYVGKFRFSWPQLD